MQRTSTPDERLGQAQAAAREGRFAEALEGHLWFHRHALDHDPSMYGVRLSFALGDWVDLGQRYPPALEALHAERESAAARLRAVTGAGTREDIELFVDVESIDDMLEDGAATVELFTWLAEHRPDVAADCADRALDLLVRNGLAHLAVRFLPALRQNLTNYGAALNRPAPDGFDAGEAAHLREALVRFYAVRIQSVVEVLRAAGQDSDAEGCLTAALDAVTDPGLRSEVAGWMNAPDGS